MVNHKMEGLKVKNYYFRIFDFSLSEDDMERMGELKGERISFDPDTITF